MRILTLVFGFMLSLAACAQEAAPLKFKEGVDYTLLPKPVKTITPGKIEVTEAFSYGCSHCFRFEPLIKKWAANAPSDVELVKLPVIWRPSMQPMARIMYTGESLGMSEKVNEAFFNAIHKDRKNVNSEEVVAEIFKGLGVDSEKFNKTFKSFGVSSKVQQASARTRSMQIRGTPQMIIDGRYSVEATKDRGHAGMLEVVDFLVDKVRAEKGKS